jgi:hypothetical protein
MDSQEISLDQVSTVIQALFFNGGKHAELYSLLLPAVFILIGGGLMFIITRSRNGHREKAPVPVKRGVLARWHMGHYLAGFPGSRSSAAPVFCMVTENEFVFCRGRQGRHIGTIPRATINMITITTRSQVLGHVTVQDIAACAQVIPPASIRNRYYCLIADWDDASGAQHNTVFEFTGDGDNAQARHAMDCFEQWKKQRIFRKPDVRAAS